MFGKHLTYATAYLRRAYMYLAHVHSVRMEGDRRYYDLVMDSDGIPLLRTQCELAYVDATGELCDAYLWSSDCVTELMRYGGDQDVITHTYIISWPPYDWAKVSLDDLIEIGVRIAREFFSGHHVLIAAHMDREHPHIHVCVQALRAADRDPQPWMLTGVDGEVLPCEVRAGGKHHHTPAFENALCDYELELSRAYGLDDTDFRRIEDRRRKEQVEERKKKLRDALHRINAEYRCGMDMGKLAYLLELYCGARIVARKDHTLRIGYGRNGKTYPLEAWGLTPADIRKVLAPERLEGTCSFAFGVTDWPLQQIMDSIAIARAEDITDYGDALCAADLSAAEMRFFSDRRDAYINASGILRPYVVAAQRYLDLGERIRKMELHGVEDDADALKALRADQDALGERLDIGNSDIYGMLRDYNWMQTEIDRCDRRLSGERERKQKLKSLQSQTLLYR